MSAEGPVSDAEMLESPGLSPRTTRAVAVLLALLLVAGAAGYLVDRGVRRGEARALDACTARASTAVERAYRPIVAMWSYVRPALDNGASLMVRQSIYVVMTDTATGRSRVVARARDDCADVRVLSFHRALRARQDRCVRRLEAHVRFLEDVSADGRALGGAWPAPVAGC